MEFIILHEVNVKNRGPWLDKNKKINYNIKKKKIFMTSGSQYLHDNNYYFDNDAPIKIKYFISWNCLSLWWVNKNHKNWKWKADLIM